MPWWKFKSKNKGSFTPEVVKPTDFHERKIVTQSNYNTLKAKLNATSLTKTRKRNKIQSKLNKLSKEGQLLELHVKSTNNINLFKPKENVSNNTKKRAQDEYAQLITTKKNRNVERFQRNHELLKRKKINPKLRLQNALENIQYEKQKKLLYLKYPHLKQIQDNLLKQKQQNALRNSSAITQQALLTLLQKPTTYQQPNLVRP